MSKKIKNTDPNYKPIFEVGDVCKMNPFIYIESNQNRQRYFIIQEIFKSKEDNGWIVKNTPHYRFKEIKLDGSDGGYSGCHHCEEWDRQHEPGSIKTVTYEELEKRFKTKYESIKSSEITKFLELPYGEQLQTLEEIDKLKNKLEIERDEISRKAYSLKTLKYRLLDGFINYHNLKKDEGDR